MIHIRKEEDEKLRPGISHHPELHAVYIALPVSHGPRPRLWWMGWSTKYWGGIWFSLDCRGVVVSRRPGIRHPVVDTHGKWVGSRTERVLKWMFYPRKSTVESKA